MNMELLAFDRLCDTDYQSQVFDLLIQCDKEFVPPLSQRTSTTQQILNSTSSGPDSAPDSYFQVLQEQSVLLCVAHGSLLGFMSFRKNHICEDVRDNLPTIYVTTVIVNPAHRGRGLTAAMYQSLQEIAREEHSSVSTRTWSSNHAHIKILSRMGFYELLRIPNGRGPGIDTVYYRKDSI